MSPYVFWYFVFVFFHAMQFCYCMRWRERKYENVGIIFYVFQMVTLYVLLAILDNTISTLYNPVIGFVAAVTGGVTGNLVFNHYHPEKSGVRLRIKEIIEGGKTK